MSWSIYTTADSADIEASVDALELPPIISGFQPSQDQLAAAKIAAKSLLESGAVGKDLPFQVTLYGHANDGHMPVAGYGNDTITVSVTQVTQAQVDQFLASQAAAKTAAE